MRLFDEPMPAQTINCPGCGAPISTDATQCTFCHATIATVACPSCFGLMLVGAAFCSHCGARAQRADDANAAPLPCPRCKTALKTVDVGQARIHDCATCGGVWLEIEAFRRITEDRDTQSGYLEVLAPSPPRADPSATDIRYVPCPICAKLMNRINFARISGIVLDSCKQHGTWFDRDELRRIIEFVRAGGMAAARTKEKLDLEEERRLLEATKRYAAAMPASPGVVIRRDNDNRNNIDVIMHNEVRRELGTVLVHLLGLGIDAAIRPR
jgi:Zn-finger nucleic acid-binding protein